MSGEEYRTPLHTWALAALIVGLGLAATGLTAYSAYDLGRRQEKERFNLLAGERIAGLKAQLRFGLAVVETVSEFVGTALPTHESFHSFAQGILARFVTIQGLAWAPRVVRGDRETFEMSVPRHPHFEGFRITERNEDGEMVRAAPRDEYFPVYFTSPYAGNEVVVGFDLGSEPTRRAALERARDWGTLTLTGRITLLQDFPNGTGFLALHPIYRSGGVPPTPAGRRDDLEGFIIGAFQIGRVVETARANGRHDTEGAGADVSLLILDLDAPEGNRVLYPLGAAEPDLEALGRSAITETTVLGERKWMFVASPAAPLSGDHHGKLMASGVAVGGLLVTGLLAAFLLRSARRTHELESFMAGARHMRLFREAIDNANDAVFIGDAETGRFIDVNDTAVRQLGYTRPELLEMSVPDIQAELSDLSAFREHRARLRENGGSLVFSGRNRRKDGSTYPVEVGVRELSVDGSLYFIAQVRDVSAREKADRLRQDLETQLFQVQKNEALSTVTGGVAHEFNNLLLPIISLVGLTLRELPEEGRARQRLEKVLEAGTRAQALVQELLAFTALESTEGGKTDISAAVEEAVSILHTLIPSSVELRTEIEKISAPVGMSRQDIRTIIVNIVDNAADSMAARPGVLEITLVRISADAAPRATLGACARLTIGDTGCGMDTATVERIFDPFFTTKDVGEGTGLGLSAVAGIVTRAGGFIDVDSRPGEGTVFKIFLPLVEKDRKEG